MSSKKATGLNVGGSSILVIFVLLCLTTFATLSMISANADYTLAGQAASISSRYYAADSRAEEVLAEIDGVLLQCAAWADSPSFYCLLVGSALRDMENVNATTTEDRSVFIEYLVPVSDFQSLCVRLDTSWHSPVDQPSYRSLQIQEWVVVNTAPLSDDEEELFPLEGDPIELWDGEFDF